MNAAEIARRLLEGSDSYTTRLDSKHMDVYNSPEGTSGVDASLVVTWRLEEDHREWGVKTLMPVIQRVVGHVTVEGEDGAERQIDLNHFTVDSGWDDGERHLPPSIYPRKAEVDVGKSTVKILF